MSRFTDYLAAFTPGLVLGWRYDLATDTGDVLASTDPQPDGSNIIHWGASLRPLRWESGRQSQRSTSLDVVATDPSLIPTGPSSLLHPDSNNAVVIYATVGSTTFKLATLAIQRASVSADADVTTVAVDLVARTRPLDSEVEVALRFDNGTAVHTIVDRLAAQVMGNIPYQIATSPWTLPDGSINPGENRLERIEKLLVGVGHELTDDPDGKVFTRPILPSAGSPGERWTYGPTGLPIQSGTVTWDDRVPQAVRVLGGSFQTLDRAIEVTVYDTDPSSQGYYSGAGPAAIEELRLPYVQNEPQAVDVGFARLRLTGRGPLQVTISVLPNPAMQEGDLVDLDYPPLGAEGTFRVIGYSIPTEVQDHQSVTLRKVFDPRANYRGNGSDKSPADRVADDFNRPYENLEDLPPPGEPGSPNWTEFGHSWAVIGQEAVQRFEAWSYARYNTPLTSSAHRASILVYPTNGHEIGPMIRSSGQHDGYSALASPGGSIRLVRWHAGTIAETLRTFDHGSSLVGTRLELEGSGSNLIVRVDGALRFTVFDEETIHGTYVGMVGYGGFGKANWPKADDFVGEIV